MPLAGPGAVALAGPGAVALAGPGAVALAGPGAVALAGPAAAALALPDGLALTPPMGFNDWNAFGCDVDEQLIEQTADLSSHPAWLRRAIATSHRRLLVVA